MTPGFGFGFGFGAQGGGFGASSWVLSGAALDLDFANGRYFGVAGLPTSFLTTTRASSKTNLFPTSASGFAYSTFLSGVPSITSLGLSVEEARTNVLLNSTAPATQTTASLGTGTYTLWVNGSGSATSSAGSATITGAGAATNGTPNVFVVTVAGTVTITVSGSLNAFQCELGVFGTSLIVTAGATGTRASDIITLTSPPAFGASYSMFGKGTPQASGASVVLAQNPISISDGSNNNRFVARRSGSPFGEHLVLATGGVANVNADMTTAAWSNASGKIAFAGAAGDQKAAFNGALDTNSYASAMPVGANAVNIGTAGTGDGWWNGFVERVALWPTTRISNAVLQSITT